MKQKGESLLAARARRAPTARTSFAEAPVQNVRSAMRPADAAFTLIELLVVVAIISLLVSILLPSLNKARAQSRSTLCATRIGQLTRSMLYYSEDYDEHPPFLSRGLTDPSEDPEELRREDWISKDMDELWMTDEQNWPADRCPQSGSLYPYTRFVYLYRCPEFERIAGKTQNRFNFTRTLLGRRILLPWEPGGEAFYGVMGMGEILRPSTVHSTAELAMLVDESWEFHVANEAYYQNREIPGPKCADPVWFGLVSEVGQYHSPAMPGPGPMTSAEGRPVPQSIKSGNHGYYDGHVGLRRDCAPGRNPAELPLWLADAVNWMIGELFAQRGPDISLQQVSDILDGILGG
jgi:prepilin-type N-terminal cleavage/methylation domain-containing protein